MPKIYDINAKNAISFDEFISIVERHKDISKEENQQVCAEALSRLYLNRTFLYDRLSQFLIDNQGKPKPNHYTPQSFILYQRSDFYVRANYWYGEDNLKSEEEALLYAYETPHDHSFNFLTLNYEGPGYKTDTWEYDYEASGRYKGERIPIFNREVLKIDPGKIHLYRKSRDIHVQYMPTSTTITINIISTSDRYDGTEQLYFDVNEARDVATVNSFPQTHAQTSYALLKMYEHFHNKKSLEILRNVATSSNLRRARIFALDFLKQYSDYDMSEILSQISESDDGFVREYAMKISKLPTA